MELELIPRLLAHARTKDVQPDWPAKTNQTISTADVERFVKACLSHDEEKCPAMMTEFIDAGVPLDRLCLDLLTRPPVCSACNGRRTRSIFSR